MTDESGIQQDVASFGVKAEERWLGRGSALDRHERRHDRRVFFVACAEARTLVSGRTPAQDRTSQTYQRARSGKQARDEDRRQPLLTSGMIREHPCRPH